MRRGAPLRRTPFRSKLPERPPREERERAPLRPIRQLGPSTPVFKQTPKFDYVRDETYRRFVASLPCFCCGIEGRSQAAHSMVESNGRGGAIKASDVALFPLCAETLGELGCHYRHDKLVGMTREERANREIVYLGRMDEINAARR
jgi:hypothetical protein